LARGGELSPEEWRFWRTNNDWYNAAYLDPSTVDPAVYDPTRHPGAVAWFKPTATHLLARVDGYLRLLAAHGVECVTLRSADPGRIIYEDADQIVVVTDTRSACEGPPPRDPLR